jgi:hypothetical protein
LKKVLSIPGIMTSIIKTNSSVNDGIFTSPICGQYLRNKMAQFQTPVVFILFYYDEVEVCNPLGSRHGVHKLGNCYFSILNSYQQFTSKLENIYLCCSFKTTLLKQYPISKILEYPVRNLIILCKDPLKITSPHYTGEVQICLGQVTGDNLGLHQIFGLSESFVCNYPCRFCRMPRYKCATVGREAILHRRTKNNYKEDLETGNLSKTGVKCDSIFNSVPNFHITENYCPDIMHDILEGVGPLNMKLLLNHLLKIGCITIDKINAKLLAFNYGHLQKDKPSPLTLRTIESSETLFGQSAGQTYCLIQNFGFIFGEFFERENPHWNLFTIFLDIMDIIMSPCVSSSSLPYLESLIEDHHALYRKLSNKSLRPKHHHMIHYPEAIRQIGPLIWFWTMRFEARHKFFKNIAKIGCNFKNIAKTVASRNQLLLSYKFFIAKELSEMEIVVPDVKIYRVCDLKYKNILCEKLQFKTNMELCTYKCISLNGTEIKPGDFVLWKWIGEQELPQFLKIISVLKIEDKFQLLCQHFLTKFFDNHFHSYLVTHSEQYNLFYLNDMDLFKPLLNKLAGSDTMVKLPFVCS